MGIPAWRARLLRFGGQVQPGAGSLRVLGHGADEALAHGTEPELLPGAVDGVDAAAVRASRRGGKAEVWRSSRTGRMGRCEDAWVPIWLGQE